MDVSLRRLRAEDISQVVEIEREAFSPLWVATPFKRELNNRFARYLVACYSSEEETTDQLISEDSPVSADAPLLGRVVRGVKRLVKPSQPARTPDSFIAGYAGLWFQGHEAHITEIAVRQRLRGQGIGELLLIGMVQAALEYGSSVVTLEVRVSNSIAQRLYEKYDFKSVGIRRAYYSDNREDAAIMTTSPIHTEEYQRRFQQLQEAYRSRWREICIYA